MKIDVVELTTCTVQADGETIEMGFVDGTGARMALRIPFNHAQAVAMTLPNLLSHALQKLSGNDRARYVFPLGQWSIEAAGNTESVIATLSTEDGFAVSFGLPREACRSLGWQLTHEANNPGGEDDVRVPTHDQALGRIN